MDASLKQIHETIRNIQEAELQGDLVIACAPSIAGCWLLPLLPGFQHEHPNISLHIRSGNDLISYENEEGNADVAIYCGDSITDGLHATPLLRDNLLPVCSQRYAREHDLIENPEALRNCELIHEHPEAANTPFYAGWEIWANWAGITGLPLQSGYSFDRAELTAIAAKQGLGVALGREWLVREALQKKELIVPFNLVFPAPQTYYVVSTRKGIQRPKVRLFHDWILEKARHSKPYGNAVL
ncbi:MAG: LysR substrate-binding domain-containing protein [Bilophila wadsworthia]